MSEETSPRFISHYVALLSKAITSQASAILAKSSSLTLIQWRVIHVLGEELATTSREIVQQASIDPSLISRTLRGLEDDGLVITSRSRIDRRVLDVKLSAAGQETFDHLFPIMQRRNELLISSLTPKEQDSIKAILIKLTRAASSDEAALETLLAQQ